jgi:Domain of unknown function (DUF4389)
MVEPAGVEPAPPPPPPPPSGDYPVTLTIDYPDRDLDRLTSFFRIFMVIPIAIVLGSLSGFSSGGWDEWDGAEAGTTVVIAGAGLVFLAPLLLILFREKYPRWWFDWNLQLQRFGTRVGAYFLLMDDRYPSTDEEQYVHLDFPYPDVKGDLSRGLPLVKWFLAIPHYIVLFFLHIGVFFVAIFAWLAILFTGRYPRGAFDYIEGVLRWDNRVLGYAFILITDRYPPFRLSA